MNNFLSILQRYYDTAVDLLASFVQPDSITALIARIIIFAIVFVLGLVILGFTGILQNPI